MDKADGASGLRIFRAFASVVGRDAVGQAVGPACVEGAVSAAQDVGAVLFGLHIPY